MRPLLLSRRSIVFIIAALACSTLSSCVPLVAGAAGGYILHEEGYRVQSPLKKAESAPEE